MHNFLSIRSGTNYQNYSKNVEVNSRGAEVCLGIRNIAAIADISIFKVLSILIGINYSLKPKHRHYESLEIDEFYTFVGSKKNKLWLIYV